MEIAWSAVFFVLLPQIGAGAARVVTQRSIPTWYETKIKKPSWRPPNLAFPIVWTFLYISMGYASYLVWRDGGGWAGSARVPLIIYGVQLVLNWAWSFIFFGAHKLEMAFYEIILLWISIAATVYTFLPINQTAGYLLLPYQAWVSFATFLNYTIWKLNPNNGKGGDDIEKKSS